MLHTHCSTLVQCVQHENKTYIYAFMQQYHTAHRPTFHFNVYLYSLVACCNFFSFIRSFSFSILFYLVCISFYFNRTVLIHNLLFLSTPQYFHAILLCNFLRHIIISQNFKLKTRPNLFAAVGVHSYDAIYEMEHFL